jgi:hypothetical protein
MTVEYLLQLLIDLFPVGEEFIQFHLAENTSQRGLGKLAGGIEKILHLDNGLFRCNDPEVDDSGNLHRHVVMGDDILGRYIKGHRPERYPHQPVDAGNDKE